MTGGRSHLRVALLTAAVAVAGLVVIGRLAQLQIFRTEDFRAQAKRQHERLIYVDGRRGAILDRYGRELAVSVETQSLFAHPKRVKDREKVSRKLSPILGVTAAKLRDKLEADEPFVWLRRRLDAKVVAEIGRLGIAIGPGEALGFEPEPKRIYPQGRLASHVVGFANIDQKGVEGIEKLFDTTLQGDATGFLALQDARGGMVLERIRPPTKGPTDLVLTLDLVLQHVVERELESLMEAHDAKAAWAILLEPATGQILALANRPTADPARYSDAPTDARRNRAVTDLYEPGSTFKTITVASAIEKGKVTPEQRFDCQGGSMIVAGKPIRDVHPYGVLTVREILEKSSNIGAVKIGRTLGREPFRDSIVGFGFGRRTGIELPGERHGRITPIREMSDRSPASMAMGYEVSVTALQVISAVGALANDGVLIPPRIVLATIDSNGRRQDAPYPEPRRAVSSRTATTMAGMLEGVITDGTGTAARVPGYRLSGKTGTARKIAPGGGYSETEHLASFVAFGPVDDPRLAGIVVVDTPRRGGYYGGQVAAPALGRIFAQALPYLRVPPDEDPTEPLKVKDAPVRDVQAAQGRAEDGSSALITHAGQVPDLRNMTLREATLALASRGFSVRAEGRGRVLGQSPVAGTPLEAGGTCSLALSLVEPEDPPVEITAKAERPPNPAKPVRVRTAPTGSRVRTTIAGSRPARRAGSGR